jgi:hypothetical protein
MRYLAANRLFNFAWFQSIWFLAILGQERALPVLVLLMVVHVCLVPEPALELIILAFGISLGLIVDSTMRYIGVLSFASDPILIPLWLVALWAGLAGTLRHSLGYFTGKPLLTSLAGGIGASFSYIAGMKLGAVSFPLGVETTFFIIFLCWSVIFPTLFFFSQQVVLKLGDAKS